MMTSSMVEAKERPVPLVLHHVFSYKKSIQSDVMGMSTNAYMRSTVKIVRRNPAMHLVPSLYFIAPHKEREYITEKYSRIVFKDIDKYDSYTQLYVTTMPRQKNAFPTLLPFYTPNLYNVSLVDNHLLSPFHRKNHKVYRYRIKKMGEDLSQVSFEPKIVNTQLVKGMALIETNTGRIIQATIRGEYDMISFTINVVMGKEGVESLLPRTCDVTGRFDFIGNRMWANYHIVYGLKQFLPDSIRNINNRDMIIPLRPDSLSSYEKRLYERYDSIMAIKGQDTTKVVKEKKGKDVWDVLGNSLLNRTKGNFDGDKGSFRISPILDPGYFEYSPQNGLTYKLDLRGNYNFTVNSSLSARIRTGYSFRQKQFYFKIPLRWTYNKRRDAYFETEFQTGRIITNHSIRRDVEEETGDTIDTKKVNLHRFHDMSFKTINNINFTDKWGMQVGFVYHKRSALNKKAFIDYGIPSVYHTFAPLIQLQYRPYGLKKGHPVFTLDWERAFRNVMHSNMEYEKYELDFSLIRTFSRMRALSFRIGAGVYTMKNNQAFFLDFDNFRAKNIPGGWNDDWSGYFQLLHRDNYNVSDYYFRTNTTFESPLMILSRIPIGGKYVEMERIYISTLFAKNLHPYVEWGYGFTNRLFSMGLFVGTRNNHFDRIGCRFGFEIFRKW